MVLVVLDQVEDHHCQFHHRVDGGKLVVLQFHHQCWWDQEEVVILQC